MNRWDSILVTGALRSGTTWVGKTLALSPMTYYIGEVFNPESGFVDQSLLSGPFTYVPANARSELEGPLRDILALRFEWPNRTGFRSMIPSRLRLFRISRQLVGLPYPILKDPIAVMSAEWLANTFEMDVICLLRHPAAFVASLRRLNWRFDLKRLIAQQMLVKNHLSQLGAKALSPPERALEEAAMLWLCLNHVLSTFLDRNESWTVVRFEDICRNPVSIFREVYERVRLPWSSRIEATVRGRSSERNPTRSTPDDPHGISRNSAMVAEIWREELTKSEIQRIRGIVEPVSSRFYSDADW